METEPQVRPLLLGERVRLGAVNAVVEAESLSRWSLDSEIQRLSDDEVARPRTAGQCEEIWRRDEPGSASPVFSIRTLEDDRFIGLTGLGGMQPAHHHAWVWIEIGDRTAWNQGFGFDAMREILRFAFSELNLSRISLSVYEYNPRAQRVYQKLGFVEEGRVRACVSREGRRWDMIYMGLLKDEWSLGV